jgi:hypothetical protein
LGGRPGPGLLPVGAEVLPGLGVGDEAGEILGDDPPRIEGILDTRGTVAAAAFLLGVEAAGAGLLLVGEVAEAAFLPLGGVLGGDANRADFRGNGLSGPFAEGVVVVVTGGRDADRFLAPPSTRSVLNVNAAMSSLSWLS